MAYTDILSATSRRYFNERHPAAVFCLIALVQGVAMLGISIVLRSLA
jgi:hypothetical protein